uniref:Uncharacterized protein n=1 Tax=viral metagenome TaxID=1070528 RepID=A0A6C0FDE0_9ZZZZ|tara:strand:- start:16848 stop:17261 length:414 start_codon:yes stop_codon:yes gene_type:complete
MSKAGSRSRKVSSKKRHHSKRKNVKRSNKRSRKSFKKSRRSKRTHRSRNTRRGTRRYRHMKGGTGSCPSSGSSSGDFGSQGGFTIIPSQLTDLGRSVQYGTMGAYNAVNGYDAPVNPMPFKDQLNNGDLPDDVMLRV